MSLFELAQFLQECSPNGMEEMIALQITLERFDFGQRYFWSSHVAQGYCPVQSDDW
jgi:hypothetical protein